MALEVGTRIADLVATNPLASDPAGQGDDHLRLIKACVQGSLPNIGGILGQARQLDVATSLSSTWNTQHIFCTSSATATVVLTLPPAASITSGFYFDITTLNGASVSLLPSGAGVINGAASLSIPERSTCHVFFIGGTGWRANVMPSGLGGIYVADNLQVRGTLSVSGGAHLNTTLSVGGAATLGSTLSVSGNTVLGTLSVQGAAVFTSGVTIIGQSVLVALRVTNAFSVSGAAHMNTTLSVGGATTLGDTLSVSGNATLLGGLDVKGGTSSFSTAVYMGSTLSVSGNAVVGGTMAVNGAFSAASGSFGGGGFTGNLTLGGTLTVSGATVMQSAVTVGSTLTVSGATVLASTVAVRGAATLDTTLSVSGAATFKSASSFAASVVIGTTLNVAGATTLSGAATLKGTASIGGAATLGSTLTVSGTVAFLGLLQLGGNLNLNNGIINFPAVQNPSAGANSLDDYEEGTWTPFIDYAVTGNLNVVYSLQSGTYTKIGRHVTACFTLTTSTYTHTTASGTMVISGFPFASTFAAHGTLNFEGMLISTSPNYDGPVLRLATGTTAALTKSGINSNAMADLDQNSHTSGVNVQMNGTISYGAA